MLIFLEFTVIYIYLSNHWSLDTDPIYNENYFVGIKHVEYGKYITREIRYNGQHRGC